MKGRARKHPRREGRALARARITAAPARAGAPASGAKEESSRLDARGVRGGVGVQAGTFRREATRWPLVLWGRLDSGWRLALVLLVTVRLALGVVGVIAQQSGLDRSLEGQSTYLLIQGGEPWILLLSTWQRWDALWYQKVALEGYQPGGSTNFYPLYPLVSRVVSFPLGGHVVWAELIVSSIAFLVSVRLLYQLTQHESQLAGFGSRASGTEARGARRSSRLPLQLETRSSRLARLAVLLVASFPAAFFLLGPFTEGLFLAFALASFWLGRKGQWWAAGAAGFFAALTRANGVALVLPLLFEYLRQRGALDWTWQKVLSPKSKVESPKGIPTSQLPSAALDSAGPVAATPHSALRIPTFGFVAPLLPIAGAAVWSLYLRAVTSGWEGASQGRSLVERGVSRLLALLPGREGAYEGRGGRGEAIYQFVPPWELLGSAFQSAGKDLGYLLGKAPVPELDILPGIETLDLVLLLGACGLAVPVFRWLPLMYSLYLWPQLGILLVRHVSAAPLESMSRYVLVLFPCFMVLAILLARVPRLAVLWLASSAALQLLLFHFFVRWRYVA